MVAFSVDEVTAFFTDRDQIGLPASTRDTLVAEGKIGTVEDLGELTEKDIERIASHFLRPPPGLVPDPSNPGGMIRTPPFVFSVSSLQKLVHISKLVRYYKLVVTNVNRAT